MQMQELIPKVYIVGAYIPNGGTLMAYHLGRILHEEWKYQVIAVQVGDERPDQAMFNYDPVFPSIPIEAMMAEVAEKDILICNPSFSHFLFGLQLPCKKITYIQGFNTFSFLDRFFDHYISVGTYVQNFLKQTYDLETDIIVPFLTIPNLRIPEWKERPPFSLIINTKGSPLLLEILQERIRLQLRERAPEIESAIDWQAANLQSKGRLSHLAFCEHLAQSRYCLNLAPAEGFGLVPLEAMMLGTVVLGFDGFGGRHYFRRAKNSLVRSYPDINGVIDDLIAVFQDESLGASISVAGKSTAADYTYERFRNAWTAKFTEILGSPYPM